MDSDGLTEETPFGNEATEVCPICARANSPSAVDVCEHFAGALWDGGIIWSDNYDKFADLYLEIADAIPAHSLLLSDKVKSFLTTLEKQPNVNLSIVNNPEWWDSTPSEAIQDVIEFQKATYTETEGVLSGAGWSLYHTQPDVIGEVVRLLVLLRSDIRSNGVWH